VYFSQALYAKTTPPTAVPIPAIIGARPVNPVANADPPNLPEIVPKIPFPPRPCKLLHNFPALLDITFPTPAKGFKNPANKVPNFPFPARFPTTPVGFAPREAPDKIYQKEFSIGLPVIILLILVNKPDVNPLPRFNPPITNPSFNKLLITPPIPPLRVPKPLVKALIAFKKLVRRSTPALTRSLLRIPIANSSQAFLSFANLDCKDSCVFANYFALAPLALYASPTNSCVRA
jgi:hypothetical protein